ncbi:MAG: hypothetical protein LC112_12730, partial [Flavobacteriales bacterium]|nr:hypothetical protein [Flavobacteriales bacterium]
MKNHLPTKTQNSNFQWFTQFSQSIKILLAICLTLLNTKGFSQVSNYVFSESAGTYNPITGTTAHAAPWDNVVTNNTVPLGFTFNFNGVDYTTCSINTNGFITFGTTLSANNLFTPISSGVNYAGAISALGFDLASNGSAITYVTTGTAPNRTFIVQWNNARRNGVNGDFNFQIRLNETNNVINIVYGSCSPTNNDNNYNAQVGLRGAANADFNNRSLSTAVIWNGKTISGTANTASCRTRNTAYPTSGLTFTWSPYRAQIVSVESGSPSWCAGESRNVSVTIKNIGSAPWTDGGGKV